MTPNDAARPRLEPRPGHVRAGRGRRAGGPRGGGGLVTALTGLVHHRDALWVASAMTDEDVEMSRAHGGGAFDVDVDGATYRIRLVESDPDAYDRFYNVVANPMLWFIQHYLWDLSNAPDIRRTRSRRTSRATAAVNDDLAHAVLEEVDGRATTRS